LVRQVLTGFEKALIKLPETSNGTLGLNTIEELESLIER